MTHAKKTTATLIGFALAIHPVMTSSAAAEACFRAINLSGAEFGGYEGSYNQAYIYPNEETVAYFAEKGFTSVRLPFRWERLQPEPMKDFDAAEMKRIDETVVTLRQYGLKVVLDPHNYAYYRDQMIGGPTLPEAAFADFWGRLAKHYANAADVSFGLMNEPFDIPTRQWLSAANAAIAAIRDNGADNLVLVPGTHWTGAHAWEREDAGENHADVMLEIKDPSDNHAYEVHQYFDDDFSGTKGNCSRVGDAVAAIEKMTRWLRAHGKRGYVGEFGVPGDPACVAGLEAFTRVVENGRDVWVGWAYWVAGQWWSPQEPLNIQPTEQGDRPQLAGLAPFLKDFSATGSACPALER